MIAAADAPAKVKGLALLGPFVRDPQGGAVIKLLFRVLLTKPWGPAAFMSYYPQWLPGTKPADYEEHKARVRENLRRPGHWQALVQTTRTSHAPAERRLSEVQAPAVVVMGTADVDWKDPAEEAEWIGEQLHADVVLVPDVGHYPQAQAPEVTASCGRSTPRQGRSCLGRVSRPSVIVDEAARLVDEAGRERLTLSELAKRFGVAQPSLYKHVKGLDGLNRLLAVRVLREVGETMRRASTGKAREDAVSAVAAGLSGLRLGPPRPLWLRRARSRTGR